MLKWYQEPLIHFLILGTLLFFITQTTPFSMINNPKEITIKEDEIKKLITFWKKKYHKIPTKKELDTLLNIYIENEILYAEALDMKLDKHDEGMKQLLVDKLKYIVSEPVNINKISDKELKMFYNKNKHLFPKKKPKTITFGHIYFNPKEDYTPHTSIEEKAQSTYLKIKDNAYNEKSTNYGNKFYKGSYFSKMTKKKVSKVFSHSFFLKLQKLPQRKWSEPINSGYGIHLVYIEEISETPLSFTTIKSKIKNMYIIHKSQENYEKYYKDIKEKYQVIIEPLTLNNEK
ncbi:MAG TPA: peptidyl-prolyl cis-trans isomerase [Sulfurovum sp.]|nr:peptidyl-prolyl cis-trans isomerase [Sulfurovum sp.]